MSELLLTTRDLCRYYLSGEDQIRAVDNVNLNIARGEFIAITGASGSGKTTLLSLLAGMDSPTSGSIFLDGKDMTTCMRSELSAYRGRDVGLVFQSFNLLSYQTALKNVELALYFDKSARHERRARAEQVMRDVGLGDRIDHHPAELSGGEQQRVAIARAIVKHPRILFADEPTGNLDKTNSQAIVQILADLNKTGLTVVMVTHDTELAEQNADRVINMDYGKIES